MFLRCSAPIYAFAYFIPTILKTMGYTTAVVFLLVREGFEMSEGLTDDMAVRSTLPVQRNLGG